MTVKDIISISLKNGIILTSFSIFLLASQVIFTFLRAIPYN